MPAETKTATNAPLSWKAKQLILLALQAYRDGFAIALDATEDDDEEAELMNDMEFADSVIRHIEAWKVKEVLHD